MFNLMFVHSVNAANITVNSIANLQLALNNAASGDTISLANGTYLNNVININRNGITVRAVTPGGVYLNGTNDININGNNLFNKSYIAHLSRLKNDGIPNMGRNIVLGINFNL